MFRIGQKKVRRKENSLDSMIERVPQSGTTPTFQRIIFSSNNIMELFTVFIEDLMFGLLLVNF